MMERQQGEVAFATRLIRWTGPDGPVTVSEAARAAMVARSTLYRYMGGKTKSLHPLIRQTLEDRLRQDGF